jgi:hypothetical protein
VDRAALATSEKELGGVSVHIELVIGGDNFESIVNDVLAEKGDLVSSFALRNQLNPG